MTHGYQFEDKDTHHLITGWWDLGKTLNDEGKKFFTSIWADIKSAFGNF